MRAERRKGIYYHINTYKNDIIKYERELKEKSMKLYHLEKEYFLLEGQEEILKKIQTGNLRTEILQELKLKRKQGETTSFSTITMDYLQKEKKKREASFMPPPDFDPRWLFLLKTTVIGISILAFLAYIILFYIPWAYQLNEVPYSTNDLFSKINTCVCVMISFIACYLYISFVIRARISSNVNDKKKVSLLTTMIQLSFPSWLIISLFSFVPWSFNLLNNSAKVLNGDGRVAPWLALLFVVISYISIFRGVTRNLLEAKGFKRL